jgi:hypothetical protein
MSLVLSEVPARAATAYIDLCKSFVQKAAKICKTLETISQSPRLRTGRAAIVTMPLSIMLRQGAQGGYAMLEGKAKPVRPLIAGIGAIAGGWFAGQALFGMWTAAAAAASLHGLTALAFLGAVVSGVTVMPAAAALSLVGIAATVGLGSAALGVTAAVINIPVGLSRSIDAFRGMNYIYDLPPAPDAPSPSAAVAAPIADTFNAEAATTLDEDISFKKVRLNFAKKPAAPPLQNIQ